MMQSSATLAQGPENLSPEKDLQLAVENSNESYDNITHLPGRVEDKRSTRQELIPITRQDLITDFLEEIQKLGESRGKIKAQVCALYLINDNGKLQRVGIIGFDQSGNAIDHEKLGEEVYDIDGDTLHNYVAQIAKPDENKRYAAPYFHNSVKQDFPSFNDANSISENLKEQREYCGDIKSAAFCPLHGPNWSFGVLFICNKINIEKKEMLDEEFTVANFITITMMAEKLTQALQRFRRSEDDRHALQIRENIAKNMPIYAKAIKTLPQSVGELTGEHRKLIDGLIEFYHAILQGLVGEQDHANHVKSAVLRLRSKRKKQFVCLSTCSRDEIERESKNNDPREVSAQPDEAVGPHAHSYVTQVGSSGQLIVLHDITNSSDIKNFINEDWIKANHFHDFICLPLQCGGPPPALGTLSFFTAKNRFLAEDDINYLKGIALSVAEFTRSVFAGSEPGSINFNALDMVLEVAEQRRTASHSAAAAASAPIPLAPGVASLPDTRQLSPSLPLTTEHGEASGPRSAERIFISCSDHEDDRKKADQLIGLIDQERLGFSPSVIRSSRDRDNIIWQDLEFIFVLISDHCASDYRLRVNEWAKINALKREKPAIKIIPVKLGGSYSPAFLSKFKILDGRSDRGLRQCAERIFDSDYPSAGQIEKEGKISDKHQSEMVRRYTALMSEAS